MKKILVVGIVLLFLGSGIPVLAHIETGESKTTTSTEGLKVVDIRWHFDLMQYLAWVTIKIQNNGIKTIHSLHFNGTWNFVFRDPDNFHRDNFWKNETWEPQQVHEFTIFNDDAYFVRMRYNASPHSFFHMKLQFISDISDYAPLIVEDKYYVDFPYDRFIPMSGFWLWLSEKLERFLLFW